MSIKKKANEARKKAYQRVIATKLLDGIDRLAGRASSKRRWIWELLQNAKDVANKQVKVEIILTQDYVEFRHNGNPFSIENITYLIEQVSSKDRTVEENEVPKTTGKFGTGFMTTHLLSRKVEVRGVLEDREEEFLKYKRFQVLLDRSATDLEEMIQKVDEAFSMFEEIDNDVLYPPVNGYQSNQQCDTSFRYLLDEAGLRAAEIGIQDLQNAIAYTLAFIPTIQSVAVTDEISNSRYIYQTRNRQNIGKISIITIEKEGNDASQESQRIACLSNDSQSVTIAIAIEPKDQYLYSVRETVDATPTLFCEFPLVGSENFPYPVVINSPLFNPTEPRDGIWLNPEPDSKTSQNKALLEEATSLYCDFLNQVTPNWDSIHRLAKLKKHAQFPENSDIQWYKAKIVNRIAQKLITTSIVDTVLKERIPLNQALIPTYKLKREVEQFANLASSLYANRLPRHDFVLDWYDILKSDLGKALPSQIEYTLEDLLRDIVQQETLQKLATRLEKSELETLNWLNQVISFTSKNNEKLLDEYPIIPNQYDCFKNKENLWQDRSIPEVLKDVLKLLDSDWRKTLVHKQITYQVSNFLDIHKAVDEINKKVSDNKCSALREAVYLLVSCFPNDSAFTGDASFAKKRNTIWSFAREMDRSVPDIIPLEAWMPKLWKEADLWLLRTLVEDIVAIKTVSSLSEKLNKSTVESITWIDRFVVFLQEQDREEFYSKKNIFPNQKGKLKPENDLLVDRDIPEELKDVLENLGKECREKLLDRGIYCLGEGHNRFTVKDVSEQVEKIIKNAKKEDSLHLAESIYTLVSYFAESDPNNLEKISLWEFSDRFYPGKIPQIKQLPNLQEFSWKACNRWLLKSMLEEIQNLETLENFVARFDSDFNIAVRWLDDFLNFAIARDKRFLDNYSVLPNQFGQFKDKESLWKDEEIPEELKDVLAILTSSHWKETLLHQELVKVGCLFGEKETKTIKDIARDIDDEIREYDNSRRKHEPKFIEAILSMMKWSKGQNEEELKKIFSYFYDHRAQLFLQTIDDSEISDNIFTILLSPEKLKSLAELAENSNISDEDLHDFAKNQTQFKEFQELRKQVSQTDSIETMRELLENQDKFEMLKLLQNAAEVAETPEVLIDVLQELGIYEAISNLFGTPNTGRVSSGYTRIFTTRSRGGRCGSTGFSYQQRFAEIGRKGEEFVYQKLIERFGEARVDWLNKDGETSKPYDFIVIGEDGEEDFYIDAKTTISEPSIDRVPFYVGSSEWKFSENNDRYYLARVFGINTEPNIRFLKFVWLLNNRAL